MQLISIEMFCSLWVARIPLTVHIAREKKSIWLFLLGVFFAILKEKKKLIAQFLWLSTLYLFLLFIYNFVSPINSEWDQAIFWMRKRLSDTEDWALEDIRVIVCNEQFLISNTAI